MSRRKLQTYDDYARALRNGYGKGAGARYKPWLTVRDVPSKGESTIVQGITVDRDHHLFSQLERKTFYGVEHKANVVDIREQFPLLPLDLVMGIAERYGIRYPNVPKTKTPAVLTTDLLATLRIGGAEKFLPISCKYASDLLKAYELEKLEIQRLFWASLGHSMLLITEEDIDEGAAENLRYFSSCFRGDKRFPPTLELANELPDLFPPGIYDFGLMLDRLLEIGASDTDQSRRALFWLIWNHDLDVNLSVDLQRTGFLEIIAWNEGIEESLSGKRHATTA
jgi:hypothetical protein